MKKKGAKKGIKAVSVAAIVLVAGFASAGFLLPDDVVAKNVMMGNVNLSGMTEAEVNSALEGMNPYEGITLEITANGHSAKINAEDISLGMDVEKTAKKAYDIGKSKNIFKNSVNFFRLLFSDIDVGGVPVSDEKILGEKLYELGAKANGEFEDYKITVEGEYATVTPRKTGQNPDTSKAVGEIYASLENGKYTDIAVTLERSDDSPIKNDELYAMLNREPQNAEYVYNGNEISVKEDVFGLKTQESLIAEAAKSLNNGENAIIKVEKIEPEFTVEMLEEKLFNSTIASYASNYSTSAENRASNVELAASRINGKVLKPGEEFSYNETIGDTTVENGYKVAPVYANGKESTGVGGGICQVSSTLYSAVLYADLEVTQRRNHSLTVAYVPKGQDATVSYGTIDFKFRNNMEYPIKIAATTSGGRVTVSIIGTKRDVERKVEISHSLISTISPEVKETQDPTLPAGVKRVTSSGKTGYVVDTYKTVYENGVKVSSKNITRSTYKMVPTEMVVGTKAEEAAEIQTGENPEETQKSAENEVPSEQTVAEQKPTEKPVETQESNKIVRPTKAPEEN